MLESTTSHFYGKYRGLVIDNDDPTQRARLQVTVNAVMGEEAVWAMPCLPYAGRRHRHLSDPGSRRRRVGGIRGRRPVVSNLDWMLLGRRPGAHE